jgi:hypothetical protein
MDSLRRATSLRERAAALIIVLAFVVLFTLLVVAYLSRTTGDRQVAHGSFNQSKADQLATSAMNNIIGDLRQEIVNGSASPAPTFGPSPTASPFYLYSPTPAPNIIPQRSGNPAGVPNLVRRSVSPDNIIAPGLPSLASAVNSTTAVSANARFVSTARWNSHYLIPLGSPSPSPASSPVASFTPPDWVFVTSDVANQTAGRKIITKPDPLVIGRYAYAIYDEGGLLDMNVAGYPTGTTATQSGRKGSLAFADLTALPNPITNSVSPFQVDRLVGWRNYATTQPANNFPDSAPAGQAFAKNFQSGSTPAANFYSVVVNNTNGFLNVRGDPSPSPSPWPNPSPSPYPWNGRTDQMFLSRQELIAFRNTLNTNNGTPISNTSQFDSNALQYLGTFSRESNSPSFSPSTPPGSTIDYATLANSPAPTPTPVNPNFLRVRVTTAFPTRFDGTPGNVGEPLVKTRFPLSRLAWITYKGPSAVVYAANAADPAITQLTAAGVDVPISTIQAGTAANIKACFGLVWDSRSYVPASGTTPSKGQQWVYISPSSSNTGGNFDPVSNASGNPASDIKRLDTVASENREPDFFELLRATILDGSLGQNTAVPGSSTTGVTGGATVFPDVHMSNKALHVLSIGASIIDQADPDSIPTRIQFKPPAATGTNWWTAYGVESLPYITQIYPISGISPATPTKWATYLLFQLSNPHNGPVLLPAAPQVRLRVDGGVGVYTTGNGQTYPAGNPQVSLATGQQIALTNGAFAPSSAPAPLGTANAASAPAVGSATAPCGFEIMPPKSSGTAITNYIGLRLLPDYTLTPASAGSQNPRVSVYFGTDSTHTFNATMEYNVAGTINWVPYNHFIGINDPTSWINGAAVPVHSSDNVAGTPDNTGPKPDQFNTNRLTESPPYSFMKADPRATRFGIFQIDPPNGITTRITDLFWPSGSVPWPNGYGGVIADGSPASPGSPVEHAPLRFSGVSGAAYYPATFCINDGQAHSIRNTVTTSYADNDGIIRPADSSYPDPSVTTTGSSTPYYTTTPLDYHPIILNRPFRNVGELGYAFRDLPWKSLDLFTDHSADAGVLDVFSIHDGAGLWNASGTFASMGPVPTMVAGKVNLNTQQTAVLQSILAGTIWDEISSSTVSGAGAQSAATMAGNITSATSTNPLTNKSSIITAAGLSTTILPTTSPATPHDNQTVKARREVVPRAISSVSQTRTWNLMIDVIAQSGRYPPTVTANPQAADLPKFIVEGEQHYWVHVAIDRFTGQVIDKQIEVVNE